MQRKNHRNSVSWTSRCGIICTWLLFIALVQSPVVSSAQPVWSATSLWMYPVPVTNIDGCVAVSIPTSHDKTTMIAMLTTTNTPELLGDLCGATISATIQINTYDNPMLLYGNDCGSPPYGNVRLYFTTTTGPYDYHTGMVNPTQYWWADYAMVNLSAGNPGQMIPGTYTLTAAIDPQLWSDANGEYAGDPHFTDAFFYAASMVAQIGLSFGGGCFYDTGVGISNYDFPWPWPTATLCILDFRILWPTIVLKSLDNVNGAVLSVTNTIWWQSCTIQYSNDLGSWTDLPSAATNTSFTVSDVSATNSAARFYRLK